MYKNALGFICGLLFTYILFIVFVSHLEISNTFATFICLVLGPVISLGLAFSNKVRCCVLMTVPHLFSTKGRQALTAYALILSLTGPAKNTLRNTKVLSESLLSGQDLVKRCIKCLVDMVRRPYKTIKTTIKTVGDRIKYALTNLQHFLSSFTKHTHSLLTVIEYCEVWLDSVIYECNRRVGYPYNRCLSAFDQAIAYSKEQFDVTIEWQRSVKNISSTVCNEIKLFFPICETLKSMSSSETGYRVDKRVRELYKETKNMFSLRMEFSERMSAEAEEFQEVRKVESGFATAMRQRTDGVLTLFNWFTLFYIYLFLLILFKILKYRCKFLKSNIFDNIYITDYLVELDRKMNTEQQMELLPLLPFEQEIYVRPWSRRLLKREKLDLKSRVVHLAVGSMKISLHMVADYSLWWLLDLIRKHGLIQTHTTEENLVKLNVSGEGILPEVYGRVMKAFHPATVKLQLDTHPILPDPSPPDLSRYKHILMFLGLIWVLTLTEPYGLRLRSVVMDHYHPEVGRRRAACLYNKILMKRNKFMRMELMKNRMESSVLLLPLTTL